MSLYLSIYLSISIPLSLYMYMYMYMYVYIYIYIYIYIYAPPPRSFLQPRCEADILPHGDQDRGAPPPETSLECLVLVISVNVSICKW